VLIMAGRKLIIEAALHEFVPKSTNPHIPYGADEVAADTASCIAAGLSFLHFHARHGVTGAQLWTDPEPYREAILAMRRRGVSAELPWYPTYGGLDLASFSHIAALAADPAIRLAMAAIDIGTDNLNDFDPETRQFIDPDSVKTLSHAAAKDLFDLCRELKLRPYIGVFEPGHLRHVGTYLDKGWIEPPVILRFFFSDFAPFGLPPHPECVGMYAEMIEMVMPDVPVEWFVACAGPSIWDLAPAAIAAGGHVRAGIGQYHPTSWPDRSGEKPTNAEQVARVARLAQSMGREPASPAEARAILGLDLI
jgi:3-keto-5-aminohexanoate cleavage enzyme